MKKPLGVTPGGLVRDCRCPGSTASDSIDQRRKGFVPERKTLLTQSDNPHGVAATA
jgi:hypothetical protein